VLGLPNLDSKSSRLIPSTVPTLNSVHLFGSLLQSDQEALLHDKPTIQHCPASTFFLSYQIKLFTLASPAYKKTKKTTYIILPQQSGNHLVHLQIGNVLSHASPMTRTKLYIVRHIRSSAAG
jgi:hypothetical protein